MPRRMPHQWAEKSAKRRQWRMKRADFEEVPRLAAAIVAGNRLARRWAGEPRPYTLQENTTRRADRVVRPYRKSSFPRRFAPRNDRVFLLMSLRASDRCHWCGNPFLRPHPSFLPTAGHFLPTAAESTQRTPSKPMVLKSFPRRKLRPMWKPSRPAYQPLNLKPCFRIVSASPSAGRSREPALPWRGKDTLCVYRPARRGHRALRKLRTYFRRGDPRGRPLYRKLTIPL